MRVNAPLRVLFVENDDSFSHNVVDLLPVPREHVRVVTPREHGAACGAPAPIWNMLRDADVVVVGPGPMDPHRTGLVEVVRRCSDMDLPVLGICLGHQALALAFGARLVRAVPCHGKVMTAVFQRSRWMPGVEGPREVMRYHSLAVAEVPAPLRVVATLQDGTVMAVEHAEQRMLGLQFHPDSHGTPDGRAMVEAFFACVA